MWTFFMLHSCHILLFLCCTLSMLAFFIFNLFHVALFSCCSFSVLHYFHVALSSYCTLYMLHCHTWAFFRTNSLQKTSERLLLFCVLCKTSYLEILLKHLLPNSSSFYFFQTHRWSVNVLKTYQNKEKMKAPIEQDRCIVIEIKIYRKFFSTLPKVSFDLQSEWQ